MNRASSTVGIALSFSLTALLTFAAGVYATEEPATSSTAFEPLVLSGDATLITRLRGLSELQQRVVEGDKSALAGQLAMARAIAQEVEHKSVSLWEDQRNRRALVKYVLSGGDPAVLARLAASTKLPEPDARLINGAIAYSRGDKERASELLGSVNHRLLAPSLAGQVALIKAVINSQSSAKDALGLCREAILLSPGTHIEEAALRLMISIAISTGDATTVERAHSRHLLRFPNSLYAHDIDVRVSSIIAASTDAGAGKLHAMSELPELIPPARRQSFLAQLADSALRAGKAQIAIHAARLARLPPHSSSASNIESTAALLAIEGAALILTEERDDGLRRLDEAQDAGPTAETAALIAAAQGVAAMIDAPPASGKSATPVARAMTFGVVSDSPASVDLPDSNTSPQKMRHYEAVLSRGAAELASADQLIEQAAK
jgi:chemotaxis protein MotC